MGRLKQARVCVSFHNPWCVHGGRVDPLQMTCFRLHGSLLPQKPRTPFPAGPACQFYQEFLMKYANPCVWIPVIHPHGCLCMGFPGGSVVENPPANAGDVRDIGLIPGSGRSPGGGNGNRLQSSCLQDPMDRGAWQTTVQGVSGNQTQLKQHGMHAMSMYIYIHLSYIYASSIYQSRISRLSISYLCYLPMYPSTYFCISVCAC